MWNKELAKLLIEKRGLKKRFVAEQVGLELSSFNQYLYGTNNKPSMAVLEKLAILLQTEVGLLELTAQKVG